MTTTVTRAISQIYFDETVLENEDLFDLEPADAVEETIDQLYKQQQASAVTGAVTKQRWIEIQRQVFGISLTHPTKSEQGRSDRQRQTSMQTLLSKEKWIKVEDVKQLLELLTTTKDRSKDEDDNEDEEELTMLPLGNLFWRGIDETDENLDTNDQSSSHQQQSASSAITKLAQFVLSNEKDNTLFLLALQVALKALGENTPSSSSSSSSMQSSRRSHQDQVLNEFITPTKGWERLFFLNEFINPPEGWDDRYFAEGGSHHPNANTADAIECRILWLRLVHEVCKGNEPNKKRCNSKYILQVLVLTIFGGPSELLEKCKTQSVAFTLAEATFRLLTVFCRFDDFSSQSTKGQTTDNTGMVVSSAHSTVTTLGNMHLIDHLYSWLVQVMKKDLVEEEEEEQQPKQTEEEVLLLLALLQCLRSLAIQDEIVTRMVSANLLELLQVIFEKYCTTATTTGPQEEAEEGKQNDSDKLRLDILTALIGLYRNLSANDELKTTLCRSPKHSIVGPLIATLQQQQEQEQQTNGSSTPTSSSTQQQQQAKLQEHVCATLGSMGLRQPQNAKRIVQEFHGHIVILKSMESFPTSALLQRQGALAIRNLASRAEPDMKQIILDAGAELILRQAAASSGVVDEAYAALRDLGCSAEVLQSNPETGQLERRPMFGEKPLQFRPVYD